MVWVKVAKVWRVHGGILARAFVDGKDGCQNQKARAETPRWGRTERLGWGKTSVWGK